jgi:hypothetical protein
MALKNFTQFTPQTVLSATDFVVGYRALDEIRTDLDSLTVAISGLLIQKGFTPGGSLGSVRRVSYRYTIGTGSPVNAVSGADDFGLTLTYTPGQIEVYRNGAHLIEGLDFLASNSTQVRNLSTLNVGDSVEIVALSATGVTVNQTLTGSGIVLQTNYRYTVPTSLTNGAVTVTGPDDFGSSLRYAAPNIDVYLNGSHLVNSYDFTATDGFNITLNEPVATGDVVDIQTLSSVGVGAVFGLSAFAGVSRIVAQNGVATGPTGGLGVVTLSADIQGRTLKATPAAGDEVMIYDSVAKDNKKTTVSTLTSLAVAIPNAVILLQDQKSSGTDGGTFTAGAWQTRVLNTEVFDTGNNCTLASNQFTLLAGTYEIYSTAVAGQCDGHQSRLANITDSTFIYGTTLNSSPVNTDVYNDSTINGIFTISTSKTFEIQHRCSNTRNTDGFGLAATLGTNEIYVSVFLRKAA